MNIRVLQAWHYLSQGKNSGNEGIRIPAKKIELHHQDICPWDVFHEKNV